ncbi:hypothetical protein COT75_01055 [Candidatus Beckwithbacteria bacterium CG10_big_fil_rev_8_21_14_0_10_34_10]|uniref:Pyruvate phosphate dikinase AMP/ATP-binding domain-containing protein n=1 Tax=Candidatus Beckwithbacteria bacterium CG10_big_fil_rev_8_21_14_0_10_34_10 TaxID=1974495 RepID=A0A2H0WC69_9BACT|nr:MAG: hypothetical protein COT75_01055 [Candidatus Beckwithbacteria bacterium CG10_big_fil_rev_8_21_14_0_10_34_10]
MHERTEPSESLFGKEWSFYGSNPGLKTQDLIDFQDTVPSGVQVLAGISLGASYFDSFLRQNGLTGDATRIDVERGDLPLELDSANKRIIQMFSKGVPVAVRSSACDERGGTGIYDTDFLVPSGEREDDGYFLSCLEKKVYGSCYSPAAKAYRGSEDEPGMGVLIQPVIGDRYGSYFMPVLSGVVTVVNKQPTLRLVIGLGTKAVDGNEAVVLQGDEITMVNLKKGLLNLKTAEAIDLKKGQVESISIDDKMRRRADQQLVKVESLIQAWSEGEFQYWEFAIDESDNPSYIVQSAPESFLKPVLKELEEPEGTILFEGDDVVNTGIKRGRGIFILGESGFDPTDLRCMQSINERSRDFLVVFPDIAFTKALDNLQPISLFYNKIETRVNFSHFSHALGVIEVQSIREGNDSFRIPITIDHTGKRGGAHFSELCKRKEILFLGVNGEEANPLKVLGEETERIGRYINFWDVEFRMTNTPDQGRVEVVGESNKRQYYFKDVSSWADELYRMGRFLDSDSDSEFESVSESFYRVTGFVVESTKEGVLYFDPFKCVESLSKKEAKELLPYLQVVLDNLHYLESYSDWQEYQPYEEEYGDKDDQQFPLGVFLKETQDRLKTKFNLKD